jgi:maltokinase
MTHRGGSGRPDPAAGDLLAGLLATWLPAQRWFAASGGAPLDVEITSDVRLAAGDPQLRHLMVAARSARQQASYQVLVGLRSSLPPSLIPFTIGTLPSGLIAYDAAMDPELTAALIDGIATGRTAGPISFAAEPGAVIDTRAVGRPLPPLASNTSIVFDEWAILKVLRRPFDGHHPDLEIPAALARGGSKLVAAPLGWMELRGRAGATVLAILSEYFPNSADGWSLATASVSAGEQRVAGQARVFAEQARLLGQTTAQLHAELAAAFGTAVMSRSELADLADAMTADLDQAIAAVPELAEHQAVIRACYAELPALSSEVRVQRVHGDLHLAQMLATEAGRWVVLDFEGEPSAPLAKRRAMAPALRDVAGMLRSFDYAARHQALEHPDDQRLQADAQRWVQECQDAFCFGYADVSGANPRQSGPLLRALTLQKAVYEAVYEASHRRAWLPIPLGAFATLATAAASAAPAAGNNIDGPMMSSQQHQRSIDVAAAGDGARAVGPVDVADPVSHAEIDQILAGHHHDPHSVLGA